MATDGPPPIEQQDIKPLSSAERSLRSKFGVPLPPTEQTRENIVAELIPKIQEVFSKEGPIDEAAMLKMMDELEKSGELERNVHTLGEGKDRALILRTAVKRTIESTSYAPAVRPRELLPIGTMATKQSEWLAINRKGFIKYVVVNNQILTVDETSAFFDGRRHPDSRHYDYSGPVHPERYYVDQMRKWADEVQGYVKYTFGEKNGKIMGQLLSHDGYPPEPSESPFSSYGGRPPQPEVDKFYDEKDLSSFGHHFHPESGWSHLDPTEGQRKASRALRRGDNPVGWELNQWQNSFYRVDSPEFVQESLRANAVPQSSAA